MANVLKTSIAQAIQELHAAGWSQRLIARKLEIDRGTVSRYQQPCPPDSKPANMPTGSAAPIRATVSSLPTLAPVATKVDGGTDSPAESNAAILPAGSAGAIRPPASGRPRQCEYRSVIAANLRTEYGFADSYDSVKWFVRGD